MIASIYDTPLAWQNSKIYDKNDIVLEGGYYYYALSNHTSHPAQTFESQKTSLWGGITTVYNRVKSIFIWNPSYNLEINNKPFLKSIKFGDGYEQVSPDGINNQLLNINLNFDNKDYNEFAAISHFLYARAGSESFVFIPPNPLSKIKLFRCEEWNGSFNFLGNSSIRATFKEVSI